MFALFDFLCFGRMRVCHMGVFHMSVFHLFWCNVPVHVAQKPARKGTQVFTNIWSVQIDIISHSLRRASSQNGTSHEGHEESSRCHWFNCPSCVHEGCRVHRAEAKSGQKEVGHERPAAKSRKSHVNKATTTKLATARGPAATSFLEAHGLRLHRQLAHATEGYEEGSSTNSTNHEEADDDEGHEEVWSCLSIAGRPIGDDGNRAVAEPSSNLTRACRMLDLVVSQLSQACTAVHDPSLGFKLSVLCLAQFGILGCRGLKNMFMLCSLQVRCSALL
jgi:hypothetical protein